ncbi:Type III restriction enzyme, res subunit [Mycoplasmopsis citelli]|uniref:Type III restriction enzyme, res subunit n=1 Tax=Mycoplasmopsis citelli TaxID=171281 RepID=A0A449B1N4_9BACT|nr:DEAD/DEAH box helicase family protein [Mycoplasmopsis citelli]VEU74444.1 Type III restriction enzyme, res subunit [Mycoplasmopsis citelli]
MSFTLSNVQQKAVDEIMYFWENRYDNEDNKKVIFKAPTGAGKTFMIANVIDQMLTSNTSGKKLFFLIATLSSAELPQQFANKLNDYRSSLVNTNIIVKNIQSPSSSGKDSKKDYSLNLTYNDSDVMIVGKSSFGKGRIFTDYGILEGFLDSIKNDDNTELIYIRDEAHIGTGDKKSKDKIVNDFENLVDSIASFSIHMTATPQDSDNLVEITATDLQNDSDMQLLKKYQKFNVNLKDADKIDDDVILRAACEQFKEIKKQYGDTKKEPHLLGINPAMLIQIRSKKTNKDEEIDPELEENIEEYKKIIEEYGLTWATYFSDSKTSTNTREKISLKNLSAHNSSIDVILFKIGPATGWDIPRACMLVQLRKVSSNTLNIQTIGRIKRNPIPHVKLDENNIANYFYIYSNEQKTIDSNLINWKIKEEIKKIRYKVLYGKIETKKARLHFDKVTYKKDLEHIISIERVKDQLDYFENEYQKYKFLIGEESTYKVSETENKSRTRIISKLENKIDLRIFVNKQRQINNKYFIELGENYLTNLYADFAKQIKKEYFSQDFFEYIIYKTFLHLIIEKYKSHYKRANSKAEDELYVLDTNEITEDFIQQKDIQTQKYKHKIIGKSKEKFPYRIKLFDELLLDSQPEEDFMSNLQDLLEYKKDFQNSITLWTKNQVHNGFSFGYLEKDDDIVVKKSYPDLFLIIDQKHMLFVEVKSQNDINAEKTTQMLKAYQKYVQNFEKNQKSKLFFDNNEINSLTIIIYKPKGKGFADIEGFSSIESLNKFLKEQKESQSASELREIIKEIAQSQEN